MKTKRTWMFVCAFLVFALSALSQAPQKFNYQCVVRDGDGNTIADQNVSVRISLIEGSVGGPIPFPMHCMPMLLIHP